MYGLYTDRLSHERFNAAAAWRQGPQSGSRPPPPLRRFRANARHGVVADTSLSSGQVSGSIRCYRPPQLSRVALRSSKAL